jgi:hypothetical protein
MPDEADILRELIAQAEEATRVADAAKLEAGEAQRLATEERINAETAKAEVLALITESDNKINNILERETTLKNNIDLAVQKAIDDRTTVEMAKEQFHLDVLELREQSIIKRDELRAELELAANNIIAAIPLDSQWVKPILEESRDRELIMLDKLFHEHDGLIAWIEPRPVDENEIRRVIERDMLAAGMK